MAVDAALTGTNSSKASVVVVTSHVHRENLEAGATHEPRQVSAQHAASRLVNPSTTPWLPLARPRSGASSRQLPVCRVPRGARDWGPTIIASAPICCFHDETKSRAADATHAHPLHATEQYHAAQALRVELGCKIKGVLGGWLADLIRTV